MAKLTWVGEDELHDGLAGPSFTTWGGVKFPKDVPVEIDNPDIIRRAKGNKFFRVDDESEPPVKRGPGRPPKVKEPDGDQDQG